MEKMGSFCDFNQEKLEFSRFFSGKTGIFYDFFRENWEFRIFSAKTGIFYDFFRENSDFL
jgi:hypothetical protein